MQKVIGIYLDQSTVRAIEIEPMEIEIDRKSYFAKTVDRRLIEDRIIADRTITSSGPLLQTQKYKMI